MAELKVRHLVWRVRRGRRLYYWQPSAGPRAQGWAPQRLSDDLGLAIAAAEALNRRLDQARALARPATPTRPPALLLPDPRSVDALVALYKGSADFTRLRPSTRRGYNQCLDRIQTWAGPGPVRAIDWQRLETLKTAMAGTPAFRNAVLRVLRIVLGRAVKLGWIARNPAEKPGLHGLTPSGLIWPRAAVADFVAVADAAGRHSVGTAVLLNEWLGQRQGDILRLPRGIWRAGNLAIRQAKTGAGVSLPVSRVPALAGRLEAELVRIDARAWSPAPVQLIVDEATGRAYAADHFRHVFAELRARHAAAHPAYEVDYLMPGRDMADPEAFCVRTTALQFLHLRHTAVTRLAEAGCEIPLISAVTGHSPRSVDEIIRRYLVRTRAQAALAFDRRLAAETDAGQRGEEKQQ